MAKARQWVQDKFASAHSVPPISFVYNGVSSLSLLANWQKTAFKGGKIKNIDLWQELIQVISSHDINWVWVKGHSTDFYNNRCDQLARQAISDNVS